MIVDTNFLLRALDGGAGAYAKAARARVEKARGTGERFEVLSATVLEAAYVLETARTGYGWDREAIAGAVEAVVDEPAFTVEHGHALRDAARIHAARSIDLHDCFLSELARARATRVLSFDADLHRLGHGERP